MKSKRYQAQEPQNLNYKKDQLQKSPDEKAHILNDKKEKDGQKQMNTQKQNNQQKFRQEKQQSKQTVRYNNYVQNQCDPQSLFQSPQNNFGQISQQMQNPLQVLPQALPQYQMPNLTQQFPNPAQLLNCMNTSPYLGPAPFQQPVTQNLPQMNIDSQQYFQLQKQIILQQHVIQMQAQVAQLQQVAQQQQKLNQGNPFDQQQLMNQQPIYDIGFNGTAFTDPNLIPNFNHQNFNKFPADNYRQMKDEENEEQSGDYTSQDDQRKSKNRKQGSLYQKDEKYSKAQAIQSTEYGQKDQKTHLQQNEKNQKKKSFSKIEDDKMNIYSENESNEQYSPQQNNSQLLGKRSLVKKTQLQKENAQKQGTQDKITKPQNKFTKQNSGKDMTLKNQAANYQNIQSDQSGFRRSTRSNNKFDPINQGLPSQNKDHSLNDSDKQKQALPIKQSHNQINEKTNSKQSQNPNRFDSKNNSNSEKKGSNQKSTKSITDSIVANEYAKVFDDIKRKNSKVTAEIHLNNECKRTTRNQMKNIMDGQRLDVQSSFIELDDYGRKKSIRLQKTNDYFQKKTLIDGQNKKNNQKTQSKNYEFQKLIFSGKKEAQTQIIQNKKILGNNLETNSVQHYKQDQNDEDYDSDSKAEDQQLIAELNKEKNAKTQQQKVEKIQIFNDQQLKDMSVLFGMSNEQIEEIKNQQQNKIKSIQDSKILFGEQVIINQHEQTQQQQEIISQNQFSQSCQQNQNVQQDDHLMEETHQSLQIISQNISLKAKENETQIIDNKNLENFKLTNHQKLNLNHLEEKDLSHNENQQSSIIASQIHENKQNQLKVQEIEYENLQKQIEEIQQKIKIQQKLNSFGNNSNIIPNETLNSSYQIEIKQEKTCQDEIEMKIELSELEDDFSEQTQSINENQQQPIASIQNQEIKNAQFNHEIEGQRSIFAQSQVHENMQTIEQEKQLFKQQETLKYDRELANTLRFPLQYENLFNFQKQIDLCLNLLHSRGQKSTYSNLKEMIELSCHKQFSLKSFRQIIFIAPWIYSHNWEIKQGKMELVIQATTQFDELSSLQPKKDQNQMEKIAFLPLKTHHINNREIQFRQLAFQHLLNDFQTFIQKNEMLQNFNLYTERRWPLQFELDNENIVPIIPLGAIKEQPEMQQKSSLKEFIHDNDSKSKIQQNLNQIKMQEQMETKEESRSQEIVIKKDRKVNQSDDNTSESETEDQNSQTNIEKQTGMTAETINHIQLRQKLEEQDKLNKKELQKQKESKANAETLVQLSDQIWSIAQQSVTSVLNLKAVMMQIIENKRGQFWQKEALYEKIMMLTRICGDLYSTFQQAGCGTMIKVHKNMNLQNYNVHRRIHEYLQNDLQNKQTMNMQIKNKIHQEPQIQKQINGGQMNQDNQPTQKMHEYNNMSISSEKNVQQNIIKISQNHDNNQNQANQQIQGNSAFSKFHRQSSQNQFSNLNNEVQSFDKNLQIQEEKGKEYYQNNNDGRYQYQKQQVLNNQKYEQSQKVKSQAENCTNVSSVETFMTGEECQSNKSIDADAQQKQIVQLQRVNQLTQRDQINNTHQWQQNNQYSEKYYKNCVPGASRSFSKEHPEVSSQKTQARETQISSVRNDFSNERYMNFQNPSIYAQQVKYNQNPQITNLMNKNHLKSNIPEIMEKVYQPAHQKDTNYQQGVSRTFENQKYYQGMDQ